MTTERKITEEMPKERLEELLAAKLTQKQYEEVISQYASFGLDADSICNDSGGYLTADIFSTEGVTYVHYLDESTCFYIDPEGFDLFDTEDFLKIMLPKKSFDYLLGITTTPEQYDKVIWLYHCVGIKYADKIEDEIDRKILLHVKGEDGETYICRHTNYDDSYRWIVCKEGCNWVANDKYIGKGAQFLEEEDD